MRIAVVTECFLPQVNGVTNSVLRICEHLGARGHEPLVVAPGPGPSSHAGVAVVRVPAVPLPGYAEQRVAYPYPQLARTLRSFRPDLLHLASPAVLGASAAGVARRLGLPCVAVYQTDLPGFMARYGLGAASGAAWRWIRRVHALAARTLAPSRHACRQLTEHGVERVACWPRGVDLERFSPRHRDEELRARLLGDGQVLVGYVGRLAREKQLELLAGVHALPGVRLVVVGDGPQRAALQRLLPRARFTGLLGGAELSTVVAGLDLFVHTGAHETFCQAAQEALASGVPVVAPAAGGLLDLVEPGVNGALFPPGSASALRAEVARLAADPARRAALGSAARRSVTGRDWRSVNDELVGHYRELLS